MNENRACQFAPFAALKGYERLIAEREKVTVPKKELTEEMATELSQKMNSVKKGMMVKVVHYKNNEYIQTEGIVTKFDITMRKLSVVKLEIDFDDIADIELTFSI